MRLKTLVTTRTFWCLIKFFLRTSTAGISEEFRGTIFGQFPSLLSRSQSEVERAYAKTVPLTEKLERAWQRIKIKNASNASGSASVKVWPFQRMRRCFQIASSTRRDYPLFISSKTCIECLWTWDVMHQHTGVTKVVRVHWLWTAERKVGSPKQIFVLIYLYQIILNKRTKAKLKISYWKNPYSAANK